MLSRKLHKELTDEKVGHESKFKVSLTNVSCQSNHTVEELSFRYQISWSHVLTEEFANLRNCLNWISQYIKMAYSREGYGITLNKVSLQVLNHAF